MKNKFSNFLFITKNAIIALYYFGFAKHFFEIFMVTHKKYEHFIKIFNKMP